MEIWLPVVTSMFAILCGLYALHQTSKGRGLARSTAVATANHAHYMQIIALPAYAAMRVFTVSTISSAREVLTKVNQYQGAKKNEARFITLQLYTNNSFASDMVHLSSELRGIVANSTDSDLALALNIELEKAEDRYADLFHRYVDPEITTPIEDDILNISSAITKIFPMYDPLSLL